MCGDVYIPRGSEESELCQPAHRSDFRTIRNLVNGCARSAEWTPIRIQVIRDNDGKALSPSDAPWLGSHALVFRSTAIEKFGATLTEFGELLPVECPGEDLTIYNPTCVLDALDEELSSLVRFDSGKVMMVDSYVFRADVVEGFEIFRIPNLKVSPIFVSERFVERWRSSHLCGLEFRLVWSESL